MEIIRLTQNILETMEITRLTQNILETMEIIRLTQNILETDENHQTDTKHSGDAQCKTSDSYSAIQKEQTPCPQNTPSKKTARFAEEPLSEIYPSR